MATISTFPVQRRITSPVERAISDALEVVALDFARSLYDRTYVTTAEISAALLQPVSMAAVLDDVARYLEVETPPSVEDALR